MEGSNLFARVPQAWAERLRDEALGNFHPGNENDDDSCWRVSAERLDFLPLAVSLQSDTIYVSYNGGAPADTKGIGDEGTFGVTRFRRDDAVGTFSAMLV